MVLQEIIVDDRGYGRAERYVALPVLLVLQRRSLLGTVPEFQARFFGVVVVHVERVDRAGAHPGVPQDEHDNGSREA